MLLILIMSTFSYRVIYGIIAGVSNLNNNKYRDKRDKNSYLGHIGSLVNQHIPLLELGEP